MLKRLLFVLVLAVTGPVQAQSPEDLEWDQLIPAGWDPYELFDEYTAEEYEALSEDDYMALQTKAEEMLEKAPVVEALDGKNIRIPGFIVPLEYDGISVNEFLLVPYFGACIHTPPPPANQIIKGKLSQPYVLEEISQPVWISGELKAGRVSSKLGEIGYTVYTDVDSGYSMSVDSIEPYDQ